MISLRPFRATDAPKLAAVFEDAVRTIGPQSYPPPLVEAWARAAQDLERFSAALATGVTLVLEEQGVAVAFGQLDPADHLSMIYCLGAHARRGYASTIYRALEREAVGCGAAVLRTEASRISRPFFMKHGFHVVEMERVTRFGAEFERFKMAKQLDAAPGPKDLA